MPGYAFMPDGASVVISYEGRLWRVPMDGAPATEIPFEVDVALVAGPRLDFDYSTDDTPTFVARQIRDVVLSPSAGRRRAPPGAMGKVPKLEEDAAADAEALERGALEGRQRGTHDDLLGAARRAQD